MCPATAGHCCFEKVVYIDLMLLYNDIMRSTKALRKGLEMSYYTGYSYFTRKQCSIIYRAFKEGKLVPPKDAHGKQKRPGFVYDFEGEGLRHGMFLELDDVLFNCQCTALHKVVGLIINKNYEKAQAILDGKDESFNDNYLPVSVETKKMWKRVF